MLERIEHLRNLARYLDSETGHELYLGKIINGDRNKTALGVYRPENGYVVYFDHGMMKAVHTITNFFTPLSLEDRTSPLVLSTIKNIQLDWTQGSYRELFIVDKYAREHMDRFRELWDISHSLRAA